MKTRLHCRAQKNAPRETLFAAKIDRYILGVKDTEIQNYFVNLQLITDL